MTAQPPVQRSGRLVVVPARAIDDNRLRPAAFRVLCALSTYGDRDGRCWPSLRSVGKRLGICRQGVQRQIRELGKLGYLEIASRSRENGSAASNSYKLLFDADLAAIHDRLGDELNGPDGGQPDVAGGSAALRGRQHPDVAPIERPIRTKASIGPRTLIDEQFDALKRAYPKRKGQQGWPEARRLFEKAVGSGADPAAIIGAAAAYAASVAHKRGDDREFIKQAATWMRRKLWADDYDSTGEASPSAGRFFSVAEKRAILEQNGVLHAPRSVQMAKVAELGLTANWGEAD